MINYKDKLIEKLKCYVWDNIVITDHAQEQAIFRGISFEEIKENIINPKRLHIALKQKAKKQYEEKYDCYFGYSKTQCHRYVLVLSKKCIVCTVVKINRRWQYKAEKAFRGKNARL